MLNTAFQSVALDAEISFEQKNEYFRNIWQKVPRAWKISGWSPSI